MKIKRKILFAVLGIIMIATLVIAVPLVYFGSINTTITVMQHIKIDGHDYNEPVSHDITGFPGQTMCFRHEIINEGEEGTWIDWNHVSDDSVNITVRHVPEYLSNIEFYVHVSNNNDESFVIYVNDECIGEWIDYDDLNEWRTIEFPLLLNYYIPVGDTYTIRLDSPTGDTLQIKTISLYCDLDIMCDFVDLGTPDSENYNLQGGWGNAISGAGRIAFVYEDTVSLDMNCSECSAEANEFDFPFFIDGEDTIPFCICYYLEDVLFGHEYSVESYLIPFER